MEFLSGREKILELRRKLNLKQSDFESENFTRGYLGLLENGKRKITKEASKLMTEKFKEKAYELGIELDIDDKYFFRSIKEEAEVYCIKRLTEKLTLEDFYGLLKLVEEYELKNMEWKVYSKFGDYYYKEKEYLQAFKNYFYALDLLKSSKMSSEKCYIYNCLGMCKYMLLNYSEAMIYFDMARSGEFILDEAILIRNSTYNLALCNKKLLNYEEAIKLIDIIIDQCDKENSIEQYIHVNTLKANCYKDMGQLDKGISIYKDIIDLIYNDDVEILGYLYNNLASMLVKKNKFSEALNYYNKSQYIRNKVDKKNLSHTLIEKSSVYVENELYEEAIMIIELGIEEAEKQRDYEYILKGYETLEVVYRELGI